MKLKEKLNNNKKFQKFLEYKESYDSVMSNPRTNALVKLSIWFVLILILSFIVNFTGKRELESVREPVEIKFSNTSDGVKEVFSHIRSYHANMTYGDNSYLFSCSNGICNIEFNDNKFYYNGVLYQVLDGENVVSTDSVLLDLCEFSISNISKFISNVDDDYFTIFKDGSYSTLYSISAGEFFINLDSSDLISVKFTGNNGVNSVEFDFSNLQIDGFYDKVFIEYSNINMEDL